MFPHLGRLAAVEGRDGTRDLVDFTRSRSPWTKTSRFYHWPRRRWRIWGNINIVKKSYVYMVFKGLLHWWLGNMFISLPNFSVSNLSDHHSSAKTTQWSFLVPWIGGRWYISPNWQYIPLIYHLYIAYWVIIYHLPPIKGTKNSCWTTALLHLPQAPPHLLRHFADSVGCVVLPIRGVQNESFWPDAVPRWS